MKMDGEQREQGGAQQSSEHVKLTGFERQRFLPDQYIPQQTSAGGIDDADHDGGQFGKTDTERARHADHGVCSQAERVGEQKALLQAVDAVTEQGGGQAAGENDIKV